jgi:hypothetical protein
LSFLRHWIAVLQFILEKRHQNLVTDLLISFRGKKKLKGKYRFLFYILVAALELIVHFREDLACCVAKIGVPPTVGQMSSILNSIETIATYLSQSAISEKDECVYFTMIYNCDITMN